MFLKYCCSFYIVLKNCDKNWQFYIKKTVTKRSQEKARAFLNTVVHWQYVVF